MADTEKYYVFLREKYDVFYLDIRFYNDFH